MKLQDIATSFDTFAEEVVADAIAEGKTFVQQEEAVAEDAVQEVAEGEGLVQAGKDAVAQTAANGYTDFADLVGKVGKDATQLVTNLIGDTSIPLGSEKANLAATTLVQNAAAQGITMVEQDATTIIKNAYVAVTGKIASL